MSLFAFEGRIHAPEFREGLTWFNTENPLSMKALRGRLVLLDFWTYCCINCMHVLPDLKFLEHRFANQLTVVGVHSPKFPNEKVDAHVEQAIRRYNIEHPVVNDPSLDYWRQFGVRAWPTLALVDAEGIAVVMAPGEGNLEALNELIAEVIEISRLKGSLKEGPGPRYSAPQTDQALLYPGKVWADPGAEEIYISDSNHHRLIIADASGEVREVIGCGEAGVEDGGYADAAFFQPQGLHRVGNTLYVADTENQLLRAIDLQSKHVETVAGNGEQALPGEGPGVGCEVALNSPWDLTSVGPLLYIAMAGSHQIWTFHTESQVLKPFAGSGREARIDGDLAHAALAQPSGIRTDGSSLYVADSEVSAIRRISLSGPGRVDSLVGLDLFLFGDKDGVGNEVRLQHPLGIAWHDGNLWVADTYNHKVKILSPETRDCRTFAGNGRSGKTLGKETEFFEPGGLSVRGNEVFVADTNNHRIVVLDRRDGESRELSLKI
ncbi:MAG: redoxin domain-containing protein [Deltaproteobacteria bacterium]|nr:redoxin domain-containing protein [Deltaproteobacteria bacterium]